MKQIWFFNAGLIFTPEVIIQRKKVWGTSFKGPGVRDFRYTSLSFHSDITSKSIHNGINPF